MLQKNQLTAEGNSKDVRCHSPNSYKVGLREAKYRVFASEDYGDSDQ